MTGTTDPRRMSAERKVADAVVLERAVNVLMRRSPGAVSWLAQHFLTSAALRLRRAAEKEWEERDG